jgi:hypothetical protein
VTVRVKAPAVATLEELRTELKAAAETATRPKLGAIDALRRALDILEASLRRNAESQIAAGAVAGAGLTLPAADPTPDARPAVTDAIDALLTLIHPPSHWTVHDKSKCAAAGSKRVMAPATTLAPCSRRTVERGDQLRALSSCWNGLGSRQSGRPISSSHRRAVELVDCQPGE